MNEPVDGLMEGERQRRRLLWALSAFQPGDPRATALLDQLDALERDLGTVAHPCKHLLDLVKTSTHSSGRKVFDEQTLPSPWRERFDQASIGSTRLAVGPYWADLEKFVDEWQREMTHLQAHRDRLKPLG